MKNIMRVAKFRNLLVTLSAIMFVFSTHSIAQQDAAKATESAIQTTDKIEDLRTQIAEIEIKKTALQEKIRQLDEAMLPENLERTTVVAGSTRPEDLRENRRRQLETEKKAAESQIELLEQSRLRIEMSIATTQPKPAPAETTPATPVVSSPNAENSTNQTATQNTTVTTVEPALTTAAPVKPAKRVLAKTKRKRIVRNN